MSSVARYTRWLTLGFQPEIVPSSVAKMKILGFDAGPCGTGTAKSLVGLKTFPVGAAVVPAGLPAGGGIVTTSGGVPLDTNGLNGVPSPV